MTKNWQTMLLAVVMAVFSWFLVTGRGEVETWIEMPVVMINPPEGVIIQDGMVDRIQVRVRGPRGLIQTLSEDRLTYQLDVSDVRVGEQVIDIPESSIPLTRAYEVMEVRPKRLKLQVDRLAVKEIPVDVQWAGKLPPGYELRSISVAPDKINVQGPETRLNKIEASHVALADEFGDPPPAEWQVDMSPELPEEVEATPGQVRVTARFGPTLKQIWVKIPLTVNNPDGFAAYPRQDYVRLQIEGPETLFRNNEFRKELSAELEFGEEIKPGDADLDYAVTLPEGVTIVKRNPEQIRTTIKKK